MSYLRFLTSGESHGKGLIGILEGIPSGLCLSEKDIDRDLKRRQVGYGRGARMKIESDHAKILSGVRWGKTIGSPITLLIENKDYKNWQDVMKVEKLTPNSELRTPNYITRPRPGHADLAGAIKYGHTDIRNILERSSARETAMRVALGSIAKKFLSEFNIKIGSYVIQIGKIGIRGSSESTRTLDPSNPRILESIFEKAERSPVRCPDNEATGKMMRLIDKASKEGNTLGGIFEIFVIGVPPGLGSHIQWDRRLNGRLAQAIMSIHAIKGVEIGLGFEIAEHFGSDVMDEIFYKAKRKEKREKSPNSEPRTSFYRKTNFAGGIEGGITNGMPIVLRAAMKPIPTLKKALQSVDIITKKPIEAIYERSDICAVPAAGVIAEAMVALIIADAFLEKFGGDSMTETTRNYSSYIKYIQKF
ncbi:MAG: chorismate synthase [Thermodesulfovibrionales bacterium]